MFRGCLSEQESEIWYKNKETRYFKKMEDYGLIIKEAHNKYRIDRNALEDFKDNKALVNKLAENRYARDTNRFEKEFDKIESLKSVLNELVPKTDIRILLFSSTNEDMKKINAENLDLSIILITSLAR